MRRRFWTARYPRWYRDTRLVLGCTRRIPRRMHQGLEGLRQWHQAGIPRVAGGPSPVILSRDTEGARDRPAAGLLFLFHDTAAQQHDPTTLRWRACLSSPAEHRHPNDPGMGECPCPVCHVHRLLTHAHDDGMARAHTILSDPLHDAADAVE